VLEETVKHQAEKAFEMLDAHLVGRWLLQTVHGCGYFVANSLFLANRLCRRPLPNRVQAYQIFDSREESVIKIMMSVP
jgi:hypothetical protein